MLSARPLVLLLLLASCQGRQTELGGQEGEDWNDTDTDADADSDTDTDTDTDSDADSDADTDTDTDADTDPPDTADTADSGR